MPGNSQGSTQSTVMANVGAIEKNIGYTFKNKKLLTQALTHRSYTNEHEGETHNERLEFLGDAILQFISTEKLYQAYADVTEGELSMYRSLLVKTEFLVMVAETLDIPNHLRVSTGQKKDLKTTSTALFADAVEAVIGALYLDDGLKTAAIFIEEKILHNMEEHLTKTPLQDAKTALQEETQQDIDITPNYDVLHEEGPDHAKTFTVGVFIKETLYAKGVGKSKQEAAQKAAEQALGKYKKERDAVQKEK